MAAGRLDPEKVDERTVAQYLDEPDMPDVDLFLRSSGEQRTSNFLLWQSAYAELVFLDTLWPDFDRRHLWRACELYAASGTAGSAARCPTRSANPKVRNSVSAPRSPARSSACWPACCWCG